MNLGKTLFAQLMEFVPWTSFERIVTRYGGDSSVRSLSCTEQFRAMAFAQLTFRKSLRDIICDQRIAMNGFYISQDYPEQLRRIRFKDPVTGKTLAHKNDRSSAC